jgi:hypothetical protein
MSTAAAPRVSVLMTIYDAEPFLERTLASLLAQTFADWELIAVENGSRDASPAVLAACRDPRVRPFVLPANIGRTPALRHAFDQARGDLIAVLDADDISLPARLERQVEYMDSHPEVVLLGTWAEFIDAQDRPVDRYCPPGDPARVLDTFGSENPIVHSSAMYRAAPARAAGGYPPELPHSQDLGLWLRLIKLGKVAVLEECLCRFRVQSGGMSSSRKHRIDVARDQLALLREVRAQLPLGAAARERNREALAIARARYAWSLAQHGRYGSAVLEAGRALVADPVALVRNRITRKVFAR